MDTAAVFMHWRVLTEEPERVLDDLARYTAINTLLLSNVLIPDFLDPNLKSRPLLPSADGLEGLPMTVAPEEFETVARFAELAKTKGFGIVCHVIPSMAFTRDFAEMDAVTVKGRRSTDLEKTGMIWGCPNNPMTIHNGEALARRSAQSWSFADMLELNHVEYRLWPRGGVDELMVCFCDHCKKKAEDAGVDFEGMKREVALFYEDLASGRLLSDTKISAKGLGDTLRARPLLAEWSRFRIASMSDFIRRVTAAARASAEASNPDLKIGLDIFLPSAANLVGTDFASLYPLFDWVSPKFPDYVPGTILPFVSEELASNSGDGSSAEFLSILRRVLDLGEGPEEYEPIEPPDEDLLYSNTFDPSIIERQSAHIKELFGKVKMYPWIWIYNRDLELFKRKVEAVEASGFDGYFMWNWEVDLSSERLKMSEGIF